MGDFVDLSENLPHEAVGIEVATARLIAVAVIPEDRPPVESLHHHVVEDPRRVEARAPRHTATLQQSPMRPLAIPELQVAIEELTGRRQKSC